MTIEERTLVLMTLRNGLGLSFAANAINMHIRDLSKYVQTHPQFRERCHKEIQEGLRAVLKLADAKRKQAKYLSWSDKVQEAFNFVTQLNYWEAHCEREVLSDDLLIGALYMFKAVSEVATVCGMELHEFWSYVTERAWLFEVVNGEIRVK